MKKCLPLIICILYSVLSVSSVSAQSATSSASSSATSTSSSTISSSSASSTKGGVTTPNELPQTGSTDLTVGIIIAGFISLGLGLYTRYALPLVLEEE